MRHRVFVVIATAAAGAACLAAPALARGGSGGHGGGGGAHGAGFAGGARGGAFFAGGARGGAVFVGSTRGGAVFFRGGTVAARGPTAAGFYRGPVTGRLLTPIRPQIINVPAALGIGVINPPFNGTPIVPPFGTGGYYGGLPVVITPYSGPPADYSFSMASTTEAPRRLETPATLPVTVTGAPAAAVPEASPTIPNALHGTCHPIPNGYHCDWSS